MILSLLNLVMFVFEFFSCHIKWASFHKPCEILSCEVCLHWKWFCFYFFHSSIFGRDPCKYCTIYIFSWEADLCEDTCYEWKNFNILSYMLSDSLISFTCYMLFGIHGLLYYYSMWKRGYVASNVLRHYRHRIVLFVRWRSLVLFFFSGSTKYKFHFPHKNFFFTLFARGVLHWQIFRHPVTLLLNLKHCNIDGCDKTDLLVLSVLKLHSYSNLGCARGG